MPDSPHLPPHHSGVVMDAPSDYQEYDELRELMAEDRRRRALDAQGRTRVVADATFQDFRQRFLLGIGQDPVAVLPDPPMPRAARRARGRRIQKVHAYVRRVERQRTARLRAERTVIKKGLSR